jgi:dTDP-4-dehydrorhamnose 3,5-epimerase
MRFIATKLAGAYIIDLEEKIDHRGFFARTFCIQEFSAHGLKPTVAQINLALTHRQGSVRGLHYQVSPATEVKLMRCIRGAIYDVIVDLRLDSPTYLSHIGVELSADNRRSLYVPEMFAHGYQTLTDEAEILCLVSEPYTQGCERGLRYDDPALAIEWPLPIADLSVKDASWEYLKTSELGV